MFQLCILNKSGLWMKVGKSAEKEDQQLSVQDSEVGSVAGSFKFDYSSGSSEVTFLNKSPEKSSSSGSPDVSSVSSDDMKTGSSFEEYLEGMAAEILKEHNV